MQEIYKNYVEFIKMAVLDNSLFDNFKNNPHYRLVLEHASPQQGMDYLKIIHRDNPHIINKIKVNDSIGNPIMVDYQPVGKFSPTTLRYGKVASDILKYFGNLDSFNIAEIGVGYGGQCLVLDRLTNFHNYNLFDLHDVNNLVKNYLEHFVFNNAYQLCVINNLPLNNQFDLVISNYAFSEFTQEIQYSYIHKILKNARRGYLTMNSGHDGACYTSVERYSADEIMKIIPHKCTIIPEEPLTFQHNYIIIWGQN